MGPLALPLVLLFCAQNPAWPSTDSTLTAAAYADPARMPGDPDFAPRVQGDSCGGQLELLSFTPECTPQIRVEEQALGPGLSVDRAWTRTTGDPRVLIALGDDGLDLGHPDLVARIALNRGELPLPDVGLPILRHDINADGAFNVLDFTSATGTVSPTLDRVTDRRLIARPDRGDTNDNGILDAQDILRIFSDGVDDDENGYADDIAGWDFLDDDNDPTSALSRGTEQALRTLGTANNGAYGAGVCPNCSALALRLSAAGLAGADRGALALLYASRRGAQVMHVGAALLGASPLLEQALDLAFERGCLVIAAAGNGASQIANTAWPPGRVWVVGAVGHDRQAKARATSQIAPDPCARYGPALHGVAPGRCDDSPSALVAGIAGLVHAAALGAGPELSPLSPALSAGELWSLLQGSSQPLQGPGWRPQMGWGRIDARAAVDAVIRRQIPPQGRIASPRFGAVLDPSAGQPASITIERSRSRHSNIQWVLEAAPGRNPAATDFIEVSSGAFGPSDAPSTQAILPLENWSLDPTSVLNTALTLRVRFTDAQGEQSIMRQLVHVHRDLFVMPAFPIQLSAGNVGGLRALPLQGGAGDSLLVATTDGRVHRLDGRAQSLLAVGYQGPSLRWVGPGRHPRIPELIRGQIPASPGAAIVAPLSSAAYGDPAQSLIVGITQDSQALALGPKGAVQAGFPVPLTDTARRPNEAPAGCSAAPALPAANMAAAIWLSDGQSSVVQLDLQGRPLARQSIPGAPGAPALEADGTMWVATRDALYRFGAQASPLDSEWPRALLTDIAPRGLQAAGLPAPVLLPFEGQSQAVVAGWGAPLLRFQPSGQSQALPHLAWQTALALGDLDGDGQADLLARVAPEAQIAGLGPAQAALNGYAAFDLRQGTALAGFGAAGASMDPVVLDVGGDVGPEVIFGDDLGRIWALDRAGRVAPGFPKLAGDPLMGAPTVGDLDGDGRWELLAVTRRGRLWAWRLEVPVAQQVAWNGARGGLASTGDVRQVRSALVESGSLGCACTRGAPIGGAAGLLLLALMCTLGCIGAKARSGVSD